MIYNQADRQLSGEEEVQTAQIAWFLGKASGSKSWFAEMRRQTLWLSCLSSNSNVTDGWVITASRSWQADKRGIKAELQRNKGPDNGEGSECGEEENICLPVDARGSVKEWRENEICTLISHKGREHFTPKNVSLGLHLGEDTHQWRFFQRLWNFSCAFLLPPLK